jgi:hypothetical protein
MQRLLPNRCPTCGQHWPEDDPHKPLRLLIHWAPRATIWIGVLVMLGMWVVLMSMAR